MGKFQQGPASMVGGVAGRNVFEQPANRKAAGR